MIGLLCFYQRALKRTAGQSSLFLCFFVFTWWTHNAQDCSLHSGNYSSISLTLTQLHTFLNIPHAIQVPLADTHTQPSFWGSFADGQHCLGLYSMFPERRCVLFTCRIAAPRRPYISLFSCIYSTEPVFLVWLWEAKVIPGIE